MNEQQAIDFIAVNKWTYAKTMPWCPHEWLHLKTANRDDFFNFVDCIRKNGYERKFYSKTFITLNIGDWYYWTMGAPIGDTFIINRAKIVKPGL